jgi:hypothetical protein
LLETDGSGPKARDRQARIGGQVPRRSQRFDDQAEAARALLTMPRPATAAMLLDHTEPRMTARSVVSNLGFDQVAEENWRRFVGETLGGTASEVTARQKLCGKIREENLGPELGRALGQRAMSYWRSMQKSAVLVVSADELLAKAEARGGKYHRRMPRQGGGYRYFYDPEQYARHNGAHVSGDEAARVAIRKAVAELLEEAGDGGCPLERLQPLVKRYGAKVVGAVLSADVKERGKLRFENGKLLAKSERYLLERA